MVFVCCYCFFFFFQAEDGIRDLTVTGVQTCALPIFQIQGTTAEPKFIPDVGGLAKDLFKSQLSCLGGKSSSDATKARSEEHTSELQSQSNLVCRLLLEKKKKKHIKSILLCYS